MNGGRKGLRDYLKSCYCSLFLLNCKTAELRFLTHGWKINTVSSQNPTPWAFQSKPESTPREISSSVFQCSTMKKKWTFLLFSKPNRKQSPCVHMKFSSLSQTQQQQKKVMQILTSSSPKYPSLRCMETIQKAFVLIQFSCSSSSTESAKGLHWEAKRKRGIGPCMWAKHSILDSIAARFGHLFPHYLCLNWNFVPVLK